MISLAAVQKHPKFYRLGPVRAPSVGFQTAARLFALIVAIMLGAGIAHGQGFGAGPREMVRVPSATYTDFRQVLAREAPTATMTISATLHFPNERKDRYPAVVVVHTLGGYQASNEGWYAAEFRKAGFATLTYDSFAARGISEAAMGRSNAGPPWASGVADAFGALRLLADHPKIDAKHIAIVGFSFGGEVAHLTAFEQLRAVLGPGDLRFAAHVAFYPAGVFGVMAEPDGYTRAPILMLLGENDDNLPLAKFKEYLAYARGAGYSLPIDVVIYPGAHHAWTVSTLEPLRFYPQYGSARKCPFVLLGRTAAVLVEGRAQPFDSRALATCMAAGRGYSMAYDASVRLSSTAETLAFLRRHLRP